MLARGEMSQGLDRIAVEAETPVLFEFSKEAA